MKSTNTGEDDPDWKGYAVISRAEGSRVEINATGDVDITSARTASTTQSAILQMQQ